MILTPDDIERITRKKRHSAQCRALFQMGITYAIRPDGSPVVLQSAVERVLGGYVSAPRAPILRL